MAKKVKEAVKENTLAEDISSVLIDGKQLKKLQEERANKKGLQPVVIVKNDEGLSVSVHGKKIGRPKKLELAKLSKTAIREIYNMGFDRNAPELFTILFDLARTDKDLLKFVVEQRIGKAAQVVSGDEQAPLTVIVRRGLDESNA